MVTLTSLLSAKRKSQCQNSIIIFRDYYEAINSHTYIGTQCVIFVLKNVCVPVCYEYVVLCVCVLLFVLAVPIQTHGFPRSNKSPPPHSHSHTYRSTHACALTCDRDHLIRERRASLCQRRNARLRESRV